MKKLHEPLWWGPIVLVAVASFLFYEEGRMLMPQPAHELAQFAVLILVSFLAAVWFRARLITNARTIVRYRQYKQQQDARQTPSLTAGEDKFGSKQWL